MGCTPGPSSKVSIKKIHLPFIKDKNCKLYLCIKQIKAEKSFCMMIIVHSWKLSELYIVKYNRNALYLSFKNVIIAGRLWPLAAGRPILQFLFFSNKDIAKFNI